MIAYLNTNANTGRCKIKCDKFHGKRKDFVNTRKGGKRAPRRAGIKSVSVQSRNYSDSKLIKPADDFYELDKYIEQFGDPTSLGYVSVFVNNITRSTSCAFYASGRVYMDNVYLQSSRT